MRKFMVLLSAFALSTLLLVPTFAQEGNLVEVAQDGSFSTLIAAVEAAGLAETLADENASLTVFAPTDEAFEAALTALGISAEDLLADTDLLTQILLYHVMDGQALAEDVVALGEFETLEGSGVTVTATADGVFLNNVVTITSTDIVATNGVIHVIDSVLLPPSLFPSAHVRVGHFSPDTPAVDVYLNGKISPIQDLAYPATTGWIEVPAGTYNVAVAPADTSIDDAAIGPVDLDFAADSWTTIAAVGSLERGTLTATVFDEAYGAELAADSARITVLHAIETAPAVDVRADGANIITALGFPGSLGNNDGAFTLDVPADTYDLSVVASGSVIMPEDDMMSEDDMMGEDMMEEESAPGAVLSLPGTTIEAGQFYFIAAIGSIGEPDVYVEVFSMDGMGDMMMDEDMSDEEMMDEDMSDEEMMDEDMSDEEMMDEDMSDEEMMDEDMMMEDPIGTVAANNNFTILVAAADAAGLVDALNDPDASLTVFAPTDEAFAALLEELGVSAEDLLADTDLLTQVLLYHVIDGAVPAETVVTLDGADVETLQGSTISISVTDDGVVLNDSINVIQTDVFASNGVIHVIDGVLLPPAGE